jgi:hypothetical protein
MKGFWRIWRKLNLLVSSKNVTILFQTDDLTEHDKEFKFKTWGTTFLVYET